MEHRVVDPDLCGVLELHAQRVLAQHERAGSVQRIIDVEADLLLPEVLKIDGVRSGRLVLQERDAGNAIHA